MMPMMSATPSTAPTLMPAIALVLRPDEDGDGGRGEGAGLVSCGRLEEVPGVGEGVGVKGILNCLAREVAYASGNDERSLSRQAIEMGSAIASPLFSKVRFAEVTVSKSPVPYSRDVYMYWKTSSGASDPGTPDVVMVNGANA